MPFEIVRNDITNMHVDAIVNTANPRPVIGAGTDSRIHEVAGPLLLAARQKVGEIRVGQAAVTPAFGLQSKIVIHTVGPCWEGGGTEEEHLLRSCYDNCLALALEYGCHSIAFPLISSGNYGFPKDRALRIAICAFSDFLLEHELQIYLVVFDRDAYRLSEQLFSNVASYIDQHYVDLQERMNFAVSRPRPMANRRRMDLEVCSDVLEACSSKMTLEQMLEQEDAGFAETLLGYIDASGKKDSEIYKRANLSRQHFSKIRNNPCYKPTKPTAIALALALELDLEQTRDLIGRAGFALTNSSKFDLIIRYFIEQRNYNVVEINLALYEFDQMLLGS